MQNLKFQNKNKIPLFWILIFIFFIKSLLWIFLIPIFQTPDENRHYDYVLHIAKRFSLPKKDSYVSPRDYYMAETIDLADLVDFDRIRWRADEKTGFILFSDNVRQKIENYHDNRNMTTITDDENLELFAYPPLYYAFCAIIYKIASILGFNIVIRFYIIRLASVILSFLTLYYAHRILNLIGSSSFISLGVILGLIFLPQLSMFQISVQPDAMAMFLIVLITYYFIIAQKNGIRLKHYLYWGVLFGFLMLTKVHLFVVTFFPFLLLLVIYQKLKYGKWDLKIGIIAGISFMISSWWYIRNLYIYHDLLGMRPVILDNNRNLLENTYSFLLMIRYVTFKSYFACFGWLDTAVPAYVYAIYAFLILLCIFSLTRFLIRGLKKMINSLKNKDFARLKSLYLENINSLYLSVPLVTFLVFMIVLGILTAGGVNTQGRHFFPFIFAQVYFFMKYSRDLFKKESWGNIYILLITFYIIATNVFSAFVIYKRYYLI